MLRGIDKKSMTYLATMITMMERIAKACDNDIVFINELNDDVTRDSELVMCIIGNLEKLKINTNNIIENIEPTPLFQDVHEEFIVTARLYEVYIDMIMGGLSTDEKYVDIKDVMKGFIDRNDTHTYFNYVGNEMSQAYNNMKNLHAVYGPSVQILAQRQDKKNRGVISKFFGPL